MRTTTRLMSLGLMAGVGVPALAFPAMAATPLRTSTPAVLASNWFWNQTPEAPATLPAAPPPLPASPPSAPDRTPAGDLALEWLGGASGVPDKEPYVAFDVASIKPGSSVADFSFTLTEDPNFQNLANTDLKLVACLPTRAWDPGSGGAAATSKPEDDLSTCLDGVFNATKKSFTFTIPSIAQAWVDSGNLGVAIRHAHDYTTPYSIAFTGAKTITAKASWSPPVPVVAPPVVQQPSTTGGGTVPVPVTGSGGGTFVPPPVAVPTVDQTAAPVPQVAGSGQQLSPAGAVKPFLSDTGLDSRFWLSILATLVGLAGVSLVLGDRLPLPAAIQRSESRLGQVLRARGAGITSTAVRR